MNSNLFNENSTTTITEAWFTPLNILMIIFSLLVIILTLIYLLIIIFDRTCHTILMMFVANSCLAGLIVGCIILRMSLFTFQNDLKQIQYQDSLCIVRAYIGYASYGILNYSFFLQALYRYLIVIYPNRLFYQSIRFQSLTICITWMIGFIYPIPFVLVDHITYNSDNQICQLVLQLSFSIIYGAFCAYNIPISLIIIIYFKLVRYVKEMSQNVTTSNNLVRAKRELKMIRRIVILVTVLIAIAFPYILMMCLSFFTTPPKYHFRIAYIFFDASTLSVILLLFYFTDPLKASIMKRINVRSNMITTGTA
ncbi:unnamed protein product [Adineta steineri]|uniref:G-protein coupled receptors family 1 profile domain-containing protein n=1 Tax=Adineta steineri TaxID=433720 RepID=A0A815M6U2_9BILA|nr:unnamed protein product [Adineta steineri]CAF1481092.1 unnamed protein product [Adineta steineri]CAF3640696.1 unnamed protein product [Adineta steineri]CAF4019924.1 unnamed protein product [Adineta steineri]